MVRVGRPGLGVGRFWRGGFTIKALPPAIFVLFLALELLAALAATPARSTWYLVCTQETFAE